MKSAHVSRRTATAWLVGTVAAVIVVVAFWLIFDKVRSADTTLTLGNTTFRVEVAATHEERATGLSGHAELDADRGMLFVFEEDARHAFWMKGMRFAIDIVWLDRDKTVVHVERHVQPDDEPHVSYAPPAPARYVLEVASGQARDIKIGQKAVFEEGGRLWK